MADRIGVISGGTIILVEDKVALTAKLGKKQLHLNLQRPLHEIPVALAGFPLTLVDFQDRIPLENLKPGRFLETGFAR